MSYTKDRDTEPTWNNQLHVRNTARCTCAKRLVEPTALST